MSHDPNSLSNTLLWVTGLFLASFFSIMAVLRYGGGRYIVFDVALFLFLSLMSILSFIMQIIMTCRYVRSNRMTKMEAWWWMSLPFSVAFPLSVLLLFKVEVGHAFAPFVLIWIVAIISTGIWTLAKVYQLLVFRTTRTSRREMVELIIVVLAAGLLLAMGTITRR